MEFKWVSNGNLASISYRISKQGQGNRLEIKHKNACKQTQIQQDHVKKKEQVGYRKHTCATPFMQLSLTVSYTPSPLLTLLSSCYTFFFQKNPTEKPSPSCSIFVPEIFPSSSFLSLFFYFPAWFFLPLQPFTSFTAHHPLLCHLFRRSPHLNHHHGVVVVSLAHVPCM